MGPKCHEFLQITPIFVDLHDKNDQKTEKFYIRTGNSSREFSIKEAGNILKVTSKLTVISVSSINWYGRPF